MTRARSTTDTRAVRDAAASADQQLSRRAQKLARHVRYGDAKASDVAALLEEMATRLSAAA